MLKSEVITTLGIKGSKGNFTKAFTTPSISTPTKTLTEWRLSSEWNLHATCEWGVFQRQKQLENLQQNETWSVVSHFKVHDVIITNVLNHLNSEYTHKEGQHKVCSESFH